MPHLTFDFYFDDPVLDLEYARKKIEENLKGYGFTKREEHCFRLVLESSERGGKVKVIPQSEQTRKAFLAISR